MDPLGSLDERAISLIQLFQSGPANYLGTAISLFSKLAVIEIALFGLLLAVGRGLGFADAFTRLFKLGLFFWFIQNFLQFQGTILGGFQWAGQTMTGQNASAGPEALLPSTFLNYGLTALSGVRECAGTLSVFGGEIGTYILLYVIGFVIFLGMLFMGLSALLTLLEYYLVTAIAFILLPLAALSATAFAAERTFSAFLGIGIKAAAIVVISGFILGDLDTLISADGICGGGEPESNLRNALLLFATASFYIVLFITAPSLAASVLTGNSRLGAGTALMAAGGLGFAIAGGGAMAAKAGAAGVGAAASGGASAANAARAAVSGTSAAMKAGAASMKGAGSIGKAAGAAGGAARYGMAAAGNAAKAGANRAAQMSRIASDFRDKMRSGSAQAEAARAAGTTAGTAGGRFVRSASTRMRAARRGRKIRSTLDQQQGDE